MGIYISYKKSYLNNYTKTTWLKCLINENRVRVSSINDVKSLGRGSESFYDGNICSSIRQDKRDQSRHEWISQFQ